MEFKHCSWNFGTSSATKYRGSHYLVLSNREGKSMAPNSVVFTDCEINLGNYRLIYCSDTDVCFDKCDYKSSYDTLVDGIAEKPNRVRVINMQNRMSKSIARHSVIIE